MKRRERWRTVREPGKEVVPGVREEVAHSRPATQLEAHLGTHYLRRPPGGSVGGEGAGLA